MKKSVSSLKLTITLALLAALSILAGKVLAINAGPVLRFSFENLPIIFAGVAFGPISGAAVGILADLIGCVLVGYTPIPAVTVGAAVIGALSGVLSLVSRKLSLPLWVRCTLSVAISHIIGSVIIKTVGLAAFYTMPFEILLLWRLLNYLLVGAVEGVLIYILLKNRLITGQIEEIRKSLLPKGLAKSKKKQMTYTEALEYIHGVNHAFCKPGLERISALCDALGNPERDLKYIHVAGTNGKGSTSSMLASILTHAGYKVGLYTSPYIYRFNERIKYCGEDIRDSELAALCDRLKPITDKMEDKPTEFELITAIAFEYFKSKGCDVVVLEVGMGGRFDSTNIISEPLLSIITGISLDHTAFLGDTTEKIAAEKAGIIKCGSPVLFGGEDEGALSVISARAKEHHSQLYRPDYSKIKDGTATLKGGSLSYKTYENVNISLLGEYQLRNAALVLEAVDILKERGLNINTAAVYSGISAARWRARFEIIHKDPTVIFDGAHNAEGIEAAVESIKKYYPKGGVCVMSGVLSDKDYRAIASKISEVASMVYTITPSNPRALSAKEYASVIRSCGVGAEAKDSIPEALSEGLAFAKENSTALFCLGSLYTYSEVIDALKSL